MYTTMIMYLYTVAMYMYMFLYGKRSIPGFFLFFGGFFCECGDVQLEQLCTYMFCHEYVHVYNYVLICFAINMTDRVILYV